VEEEEEGCQYQHQHRQRQRMAVQMGRSWETYAWMSQVMRHDEHDEQAIHSPSNHLSQHMAWMVGVGVGVVSLVQVVGIDFHCHYSQS